MHIESLSLRNFRCFGDSVTKIQIPSEITAFVGDNGTGKTSGVDALKRLFSRLSGDRQLQKSDVHFGPLENSQNVDEREVVIDVVFGFSDTTTVPPVFNDVFFNASDEALKVRLVYEGLYKKSESYEDDIDVKLYTVRTLDEVPFGTDDERKTPLSAKSTQFAELVYIPAHRNSKGVAQIALNKLLKILERSADWDEETKNESHEFAKNLEQRLNEAPAIQTVTKELINDWRTLHDSSYDAAPHFGVVATEFEQLIRDLTLQFYESPTGGRRKFEEMSEGQVSLLYFALTATYHSLAREIEKFDGSSGLEGFKMLTVTPPPLTIFAFEEPENHLGPFYLSRLVELLKKLISKGSAQVLVTSHSTSVLRQIPPQNVKYFRNCPKSLISQVHEILLPEEDSEAFNFIHQVILANPEIYFARLVIIGEGDSERIVIPRFAKAFGIAMDPSFVAFVPIGGRHANKLWKLVNSLEIPCLTLLDFDLGRHNGGIGRIKDAVNWLKDTGHDLVGTEKVGL